MKAETEAAIRAAIELAESEGLVLVGFTVPRTLNEDDEMSWSMFKSHISVKDAEELLVNMAEVIQMNSEDMQKKESIN
jgi:pantothenate kinase